MWKKKPNSDEAVAHEDEHEELLQTCFVEVLPPTTSMAAQGEAMARRSKAMSNRNLVATGLGP